MDTDTSPPMQPTATMAGPLALSGPEPRVTMSAMDAAGTPKPPARVKRNRLSPVHVADLRDWLKNVAATVAIDAPYDGLAVMASHAIPGATITANNIKGMWKALGLPGRRLPRKPEPTAELAKLAAEVAELRQVVTVLCATRIGFASAADHDAIAAFAKEAHQ